MKTLTKLIIGTGISIVGIISLGHYLVNPKSYTFIHNGYDKVVLKVLGNEEIYNNFIVYENKLNELSEKEDKSFIQKVDDFVYKNVTEEYYLPKTKEVENE